MLVASPLDLQKNELRQPQIHNLGSAPGSPVKGQLYMNTGDNTLYVFDGSAWYSTRGSGTPPDATTSSKGLIQLAGDLTGTATSPQIAAGVIVDADVAAANKDGAAATPSLRTLGLGAQQALGGTTRLDQIALPTASLNMNGQRIINMLDPIGSNEGATKNYVDSVAQGLDVKQSCKMATVADQALSGLGAVDGVTPIAGDRVLVLYQTAAAQNGIYTAASGAWTRATDMDSWTEVPGAFVFVEQGSLNADTAWLCTSDQGGTLNTTAINWTPFISAGQVQAGAGLSKSGLSTLLVKPDNVTIDTAVAGSSVEVKAGGIGATQLATGAVDLSTTMVTGTLPIAKGGTSGTDPLSARTNLLAAGIYMAANTAGTTTTIPQSTHGLQASRSLVVQVRSVATGEEVIVDNTVSATGTVVVTFATSQTAGAYWIMITG